MTQSYLLEQLLNSNSGITLISALLDENNNQVDQEAEKALSELAELSKFNGLTDIEKAVLFDHLIEAQLNSELTAFKMGVDFALILTGAEPIFNILPDQIDLGGLEL